MSVVNRSKTPVERNAAPAVAARPLGNASRMVGRAAAYILLLAAIMAALAMIIVPLVTGSQTYTVLTNSMAPKYAPGTFLVVKPAPFENLQVGDIITYQIESGKADVITHRISSVGVGQDGARALTTKGDNNSLEDTEAVQAIQVKGKLFYAIPYVGFVANAVGQDRHIILPIVAVGLIGFGALTMVKGTVEKKRARPKGRRSK
ncbi:signal peptidase I [Arthrobacter antibioticus]|uniref:signal peptidase I n=1 Tax=Arthrobacter sp. H35-MC1 TaxID=3046203 RepID=UPI0024BA5BD2|nr:signal peptidase I [Arthrobacter sp. H35-MC1]MDJ0317136.1 signal peptidase I [Arthrobacter sp. H35-MC1]